jgi:DNA-binding CsgD family transcriptional regulator
MGQQLKMDNTDNHKYLEEYNKVILPRLDELIEPLRVLGVSYFTYVKIIENKKCFYIGNHQEFNDKFFSLKLYNNFDLTNWAKASEKGILPYIRLWKTNTTINADKIREELKMGMGITMYRTTKEYKEGWSFGGTHDEGELVNFLINNYDLLLKYILYFKSVAADIIDTSDERKLINVNLIEESVLQADKYSKIISAFNEGLEKGKYLIESPKGQFFLTKREVDCLYFKSQGDSAKDIARKMNISNRTVENFINNIKLKSQMTNLSETIKICQQQGLI